MPDCDTSCISKCYIKDNVYSELKPMIEGADCLTIHIPNNDNSTFIDIKTLIASVKY